MDKEDFKGIHCESTLFPVVKVACRRNLSKVPRKDGRTVGKTAFYQVPVFYMFILLFFYVIVAFSFTAISVAIC